jgi:1,4-alpha-glucan branching enzyme
MASPQVAPKRNDGRDLDRATLLTDDDLYWFNEGTHAKLYEKLGAHPMTVDGTAGTYFAVWAPNARSVVAEAFGHGSYPLRSRGGSGIWEGFAPELGPGALYKYRLQSNYAGYQADKADPFAFHGEIPPKTASVIYPLEYDWRDQDWMANRGRRNALDAPISMYEVHLGSWRRNAEGRWFSYRELAPQLIEHVERCGFTHVEFMPIMEHPFYGSWGYQTTSYFAPTARYGSPADFMYLIDQLHQHGIGVVLDWVPSHFPTDGFALSYFDGTHLYEHADPRKGFHPDWKSFIFNYGRAEVRSFLTSSALFWLDKYHVEALRVDAVASMLYLDYSRKAGEWIPNEHGGNENIEAISFLRQINQQVYRAYPDTQTIAEESTAWPMVSRPVYVGGLGFGMKWDMGWMHDTLHYLAKDPVYRKFEHNALTFRAVYQYTENFVLSLSHDEVVYGKGSIFDKMAGDEWQKFANLRLLYGYMFTLPGKKLLFMGDEFGERREWNHEGQLDWGLLADVQHEGILRWIGDLNRTYRQEPSLYEMDTQQGGFEWLDCCDTEASAISYLRCGRSESVGLVVVCNFTPVPRHNYRLGVPMGGWWREIVNSDAPFYGGSGQGNLGGAETAPIAVHGRPHSLNITLPPLGMLVWKHGA